MDQSVTLQSVASETGVSVRTVLQVLRNKHDVSPRTPRPVSPHSDYPLFSTFAIGLLIERLLYLLKRTIAAYRLSHIEAALAQYERLMTVVPVADRPVCRRRGGRRKMSPSHNAIV